MENTGLFSVCNEIKTYLELKVKQDNINPQLDFTQNRRIQSVILKYSNTNVNQEGKNMENTGLLSVCN